MSRNPHAVALGKKGGKFKSDKKAKAVRENGKKGGRPDAETQLHRAIERLAHYAYDYFANDTQAYKDARTILVRLEKDYRANH